MRTFFLLLLLLCGLAANSQTPCNCTAYPYKPDSCFFPCSKNLLAASTLSELRFIIGLNDTLARKVDSTTKSGNVQSFNDYLMHLTQADRRRLIDAMKCLCGAQRY